ncbi:hypothetical protein TPA4_34 [Tsukamurella phage TPA4]|uniref:hypothetical protein n=1 Tax=Tsukamurella phage TPA4 TaxID=1647476 RepID=UPI0007B62F7B|nr:hypothetical protein BH784_gp34 [Tsukamurella phage TPA4]AKJ72199.1 hypothetical protein TPA4_34 [Tsukamurella phage TPA4]
MTPGFALWILAEQADADSGWDILARLVDNAAAIIAAIAAAIALVLARRAGQRNDQNAAALERMEQTTNEVREHVANDHPNLRADLDAKVAALGKKLDTVIARMDSHDAATRELNASMAALDERTQRIGNEVRTNNTLRRDADTRMSEQMAKMSESIANQERIARLRHPDDMI